MISALSTAPIGSIEHWHDYGAPNFGEVNYHEAAILCRNTAPLVSFAFQLLARGVACHIVGKDIEVGLQKLVDKPQRNILTEIQHLQAKGKRQQAANLRDKLDAILAIRGNCTDNQKVKDAIAQLFANGLGLTLSTIHKSKGLEWTTVFLLDFHLLPSPYAEADWEKQQERNLQYVAVTRAKLNLIYLKSGQWRKQQG